MTGDPRNAAPSLQDWRTWALLAAVWVAAGPVLAHSLATVGLPEFDRRSFWVLAALSVAVELVPLVVAGSRTPGGAAMSTGFTFAILLHWGLAPALLVRLAGMLLFAAVQRWSAWRTAFNLGQYTVSWGATALAVALAGRSVDPSAAVPLTGADLASVAAGAATFLAVNTTVVGLMVSTYGRQPVLAVLRGELPLKLWVNGSLLALAPLVVLLAERSPWLLPLAVVPLLAFRQVAALSARQEHAAQHDALTGLPNRVLFAARTRRAVDDAATGRTSTALLLLDLDRFKEINDAFGHPTGDQLLEQVAARLVGAARPTDTVARLGGDEFAVLLTGLPPAGAAAGAAGGTADGADAVAVAEDLARRLSAALARPFPLQGVPVTVTVSIGIAVCPVHGTDPDALLARADAAMYTAKGGLGPVATSSPEIERSSPAQLALLGELRQAVAGDRGGGRLTLHYQPQVALADGTVTGAEALLRWHHPTRGLLPPSEFLPLSGHGARVHQLTRSVLLLALDQQRRWAADGLVLPVAVNVTAWDLPDPGFADWVARQLDHHGVAPGDLVLEVTETALMVEAARSSATLRALAALGVAISLDDFGTGYASLTNLRMLPVSEVKIDRSFVAGMRSKAADETVVRSIIELGRALGLRTVAEGVEDAATRDALLQLGCTQAQGHHFAPALPPEEFARWLATAGRSHPTPAPAGSARAG